MRVLFIGDVVAQGGRNAIKAFVPALRESENLTFVVANGENAAGGKGIDEKTATELFNAGVDLITGGNHSWDKKEALEYIDREPRLLRPANYPQFPDSPVPGKGHGVLERNGMKLGVINLMGRVHMEPSLDCPFQLAPKIAEWFKSKGVESILVDFHAEATSEKQAFGHYMTGKVSAVFGTHSHVQTSDERILSSALGNTAYITDAGMTGPYDSVIGMKKERSIARFLTKMPTRYEPAENHNGLHGVIVDIDPSNGFATAVRRVSMFLD